MVRWQWYFTMEVFLGIVDVLSSNTVSNEITLGDTNITKFRIPGIGITFGDNSSLTDGHVLTYSSSTGRGYSICTFQVESPML